MTEKATIARPYAKAAFEYAQEHNALARWSQILARAAAVVADPRVATLLSNPRVTTQELATLVEQSSGGDADEQGGNFIAALANSGRLALLPEIAAMYEVLRAQLENVADVQVTSAIPLEEAQRQRLGAALKKRLNREVRLHCDVDAQLLGGAIVRSGDMVIDGSLRGRLDRLAYQMIH